MEPTALSLPAPLRVTAYFVRVYAKSWRGSVVATVLNPLLFLVALGVGLGSVIDRHGHAPALGHVSYLAFVAPALAASTAMEIAAGEATFPVFGAIKWNRTYEAMLATPLGVTDVLVGHLIWIQLRVAMAVTGYLAVVAAFGTVHSLLAIADLPVGLITGLAFATPLVAFSGAQTNDQVFSAMFRLGIVPLFLFSGTFFPISQLPTILQVAAELTPLYHGVALCRAFALGQLPWAPMVAHLGYLVGLSVIGFVLARRTFAKRLRS